MPGPMFGNPYDDYRAMMFHDKCQKGIKCTGPGCRVYTGKTAVKHRKRGQIPRRKRANRDRNDG